MQTVSGIDLNPIGIGTWNINSRFNSNDPTAKYKGTEAVHGNEEESIDAIRYSISKGQNHIDCAELYGAFYTDEVVGRAIADQKREDLYIADKLWKTSVAKGKVRPTVELMLKKLGTDYLDMLYIHSPWEDAPWLEAIPQIDELISEGVVRHFGVSNFNIKQMKQAMSLSKYPTTANQMNFNVLYRDEVDQAFIDFCKQNNITIVAYQPIKRGEALHNRLVMEIARKHSATPSQVALAWLIKVGALTIPKSLSKEHIDENLGALDLVLTDEEFSQLWQTATF